MNEMVEMTILEFEENLNKLYYGKRNFNDR